MQVSTVNVTPEDIERHLKDAVMNSAIGETLKKVIREKLNGWEFDKAVALVVNEEVPKIIRNVMLEEGYRERIAAAVREALTDTLVLRIANKSIEHLWK